MPSSISSIVAVSALVSSVCGVAIHPRSNTVGRAIYFLSNGAENAVAALPVQPDGTLAYGTLTPTGGSGSNAIDGSTMAASAPDALVGQSALSVAGNNIFAVNAGCNTLTMLQIDMQDPTKLTKVGQPIAIPGEFPNTVAASVKNSLVCVGTTGAKAGISCASFSDAGLTEMDSLRPFELNQVTPPLGPTNTVSHVFFSEDESQLFTTVKGDPTVNNTGFLSVFPVNPASACGAATLGMNDTRTSPQGTAVLFGSAVIPGTGNIFVTDASFGAAVMSVTPGSGEATLIASQAIEGQKATCWATVAQNTQSAFVTDVATNRIVEMSLQDASILATIDLSANGDPGLIDLKAAGNFVYALSPGNGTTPAAVTVVDISGGQGQGVQKQHIQFAGGVDKNAMGMAVLF